GADLTEARLEKLMQFIDDRTALFGADSTPLLGRRAAYLVLDGVKHRDPPQDLGSNRRAVGQFVELAPHMRPAEGEPDLLAPARERAVAAIAVDLQNAAEVFEVFHGPLGLAVGGIDIG